MEKSEKKRGCAWQLHLLLLFPAGTIASLDDLVKEFVSADENEKVVFSRLEEEVKKLKGSTARYGSLYLKLAKNSMEKGADYAKNEIQRLERVLEKSICNRSA